MTRTIEVNDTIDIISLSTEISLGMAEMLLPMVILLVTFYVLSLTILMPVILRGCLQISLSEGNYIRTIINYWNDGENLYQGQKSPLHGREKGQ